MLVRNALALIDYPFSSEWLPRTTRKDMYSATRCVRNSQMCLILDCYGCNTQRNRCPPAPIRRLNPDGSFPTVPVKIATQPTFPQVLPACPELREPPFPSRSSFSHLKHSGIHPPFLIARLNDSSFLAYCLLRNRLFMFPIALQLRSRSIADYTYLAHYITEAPFYFYLNLM